MISQQQRDALYEAACNIADGYPIESFREVMSELFPEDDPSEILELAISSRRDHQAPQILAALLHQTHYGNDDRLVARAVSLSDKLARAIVTQPVAE